MAKKVAKIKSTGGYGFTLEDKVAAMCLSTQSPPPEVALHRRRQTHWAPAFLLNLYLVSPG